SRVVAGPDLVVGPRTLECGRLAPLARLPLTVVLTNSTAQPVEIRRVRTSCSCVIPPWRERTLPAGTGLEMPLELVAGAVSGPFVEQLDFDSSHPDAPQVRIVVRGEVYQPIEVVPAFVTLPVTPDAWADERAVARVINHEPEPMELTGLQGRHPAFAGRWEAIRPGFEYRLEVRVTQALPNGNHYGVFEVTTPSPQAPRLEFTVFVPGLPAVAVGPPALRLPAHPGPGTTSGPVHLRSTTGQALEVRAVAPPPAGLRVLLRTVEPGRLHRLEVVTTEGFPADAGTAPVVELESNHPSHRTLRIPVMVGARPQ
ncbi:MAG: DUF1573 domain-containing protein, partial [Verrucomicrobiota bacterium]